ncbi:cell division protein ZapE [Nocardia sp. CS682]|uniref:cell division protein ZapE n=1 Tax=Nocardia sp. CS682 TaxID=1047172 RepID=UPI001075762F|nr:cell division protein ZapE [Nocardia sp. CS682]QBS42630.1 cell division protein ZapE [Nocardia sp. CS682]
MDSDAASKVVLDAEQVRAVGRLGELVDRRGRPVKGRRGVYLWGRPGRGKTMVMDRFFAGVGSDRKRRFHFHQFFVRLHEAAHATGSIDAAVAALLGDARLVCFDEFHVHDIGDAMLIARMLDALFARRVTLVVTSNYPPEQLLPNPLFHDRFLPTIARIAANLAVVSVDGPVDYRTRADRTITRSTGFAAGAYRIVSTELPHDTPPLPVEHPSSEKLTADSVSVQIGTRRLTALSADDTTLTIEFAALCGTSTAAADYVELSRRFRRWIICDVPPLRDVPPDWAMRFVNVVDVLYDADRELTVRARVPLADLVDGVRGVLDIARLASRLCELSQLVPSRIG